MKKIDIVKELLKDLEWYEQKEVANLILDDCITTINKDNQESCQICRKNKATVNEGISKLRQCGSCYTKIWQT